ncbi:hypothetical protein [Halococcoides cellulosivorans]|uniref:Dockerin domain-containing protein n=1 Tax=Halococcoides cellulosivorans TaxID=1679096 RepID=A0A2R4WYD0_9EURY|nr:hypothetical protein [Halococcoides cellulosivorans]AWB26542.1 hypothetical protein HARCEL1_01850 [Halococcoides cellulosivorans]
MTEHSDYHTADEATEESTIDDASRRTFLKGTVGAGLLATGAGAGLFGSATAAETLLVDDFDDWSHGGSNAMGGYTGAGGFATASASGGVMTLETAAEETGWFATTISGDVSSYDRLELVLAGSSDNAGEAFTLGGTPLGDLADGSVSGTVQIPTSSLDVSDGAQMQLNGAWAPAGTLEIDAIRFASGDSEPTEPTTEETPTPTDGEETTVDEMSLSAVPSVSGDSGTVDVVLSEVPSTGLSGFEIDLSIADTDVAAFETGRGVSAEFPDAFSSISSSSLSESTATVKASDGADEYTGGETDVLLATVPVVINGDGATTVSLSITKLQDDDGTELDPTLVSGSIPPGTEPTTEPGTDPTVEGTTLSAAPSVSGDSGTVDVVLSEVPSTGLSGFEIDLSIADTSVAAFETGRGVSAEFPEAFSSISSSSLSESTATVKASDGADAITGGETDVLLATVPIVMNGDGATTVSLSITKLQDDDGTELDPTLVSGSIPPGTEPTTTDGEQTPGEFNLIPRLDVENINLDGTADVSITLDEVPEAGLSGFELDVTIADTSVAAFDTGRGASAEFPEAFSSINSSSFTESTATVKASDGADAITGGETDVLLATVPVVAVGGGSTDISVSITKLQTDGAGDPIDAVTMVTTLTVDVPTTTTTTQDGPGTVEEGLSRPSDTDGDGFFGDLNGNGRIEYMDVILFIDHLDDQVIQGNVDAFDADGDGDVDLNDVVALFDMI